MRDIERYYDNTGAGNDTVYLIKSGWNVLAIDREYVIAKKK